MNNPFQNFNNKYTPSNASLAFVLSKIEVESSNKKSPLYTWVWAGSLSFAGMTAAFLLFFQNTNVLPPNNNIIVSNDIKVSNNKTNKTIDEALITVASFNDNNELNNKF